MIKSETVRQAYSAAVDTYAAYGVDTAAAP